MSNYYFGNPAVPFRTSGFAPYPLGSSPSARNGSIVLDELPASFDKFVPCAGLFGK